MAFFSLLRKIEEKKIGSIKEIGSIVTSIKTINLKDYYNKYTHTCCFKTEANSSVKQNQFMNVCSNLIMFVSHMRLVVGSPPPFPVYNSILRVLHETCILVAPDSAATAKEIILQLECDNFICLRTKII